MPNGIFIYRIMLQQQKIDMKPLCTKQTTFQAVAYLGFTAPGDKLSLSAPSPFVAAQNKRNTAI